MWLAATADRPDPAAPGHGYFPRMVLAMVWSCMNEVPS
jgi:hypothetical protein